MSPFSPAEMKEIKRAAAELEKQREAWGKDKLEVFEQLLKIKAFTEWAKDNLVINRHVDHLNREVQITVIYKGEYEGNKTSLQRLEEIKELCAVYAGTELADKITGIIDFDETKEVVEEEKKDE